MVLFVASVSTPLANFFKATDWVCEYIQASTQAFFPFSFFPARLGALQVFIEKVFLRV